MSEEQVLEQEQAQEQPAGVGTSDLPNTQEGGNGSEPPSDFTLPEGWIDALDDDIKGAEVLKQIKDIPSMAKMLVHAQKMIGRDKVPLPSPNASEEEWEAFFTAIGRPKDPADYDLVPPDDIPEDIPIDDKLITDFMEQAHKAGLLPQQAKHLFNWYMEKTRDSFYTANQQAEQAREEAEKALKREWGALYNQKLEKAQKAAFHFFGKEGVAELEKSGLANNPLIIKALSKIGEAISEDTFVEPDAGQTKVSAKAEIERILSDRNHPYHNKDHVGHEAAVARMHELFKQLHGE